MPEFYSVCLFVFFYSYFPEDKNRRHRNISIKKIIVEKNSLFQKILIFDSKYFGRVMALDQVIQITERDHYGYSEMLTHVPILTHGKIKKVFFIIIAFKLYFYLPITYVFGFYR